MHRSLAQRCYVVGLQRARLQMLEPKVSFALLLWLELPSVCTRIPGPGRTPVHGLTAEAVQNPDSAEVARLRAI